MAIEKVTRTKYGFSRQPLVTIGGHFFYFNRAFANAYQLKLFKAVKFGVDYQRNRFYFKLLTESKPGTGKLIHNHTHNSYVMTIPAEFRKYKHRQPLRRTPMKTERIDITETIPVLSTEEVAWDFWIKGTLHLEKGGD
jgi:hypothetical protein